MIVFLVIHFLCTGEALVKFELNTTGQSPAKLYLYISDDWKDVQDENDCVHKLQKSRLVCKSVHLWF